MKVKDRMSRAVTSISETQELGVALQVMLWGGFRHLPVVRDQKVIGVVSERDVLERRGEPNALAVRGTVADVMRTDVEVTSPNEPLENAAARMAVHKIGCLPVVSAGVLVGILTTTDLLTELAQCEVGAVEVTDLTAGGLMTDNPFTTHMDDRLIDAAARMINEGVRHLPVVDAVGGVVGMLSDRDVRSAVGNPLRSAEQRWPAAPLEELRVHHAMTAEPRAVQVSTELARLMEVLMDERVGALPVLDGETLVGIVSYLDVLRAVHSQQVVSAEQVSG